MNNKHNFNIIITPLNYPIYETNNWDRPRALTRVTLHTARDAR